MNFIVKPSANDPKTFYLNNKKSVTYGNYMVSSYNESYYGVYTAEDYYKKDLLLYSRNWDEANDFAYNLQKAYNEGYSAAYDE